LNVKRIYSFATFDVNLLDMLRAKLGRIRIPLIRMTQAKNYDCVESGVTLWFQSLKT